MMTEHDTPDLRTRFFHAVRDGDLEAVRAALSEDGRLVEHFDPEHFEANPVTVAVHHGHVDMIDLLLEHGADIDRKSAWWAGGFAPIHSIPRHLRGKMLPALLERGATLDLHAAAQHGDAEAVVAFLDEDPSRIDERGGDGKSPLCFAETVEVARVLVERGADLEHRCVDHWSTPAQWTAPDRPEVCRYLIDQGARTDVWMLTAIDDTEGLARLLNEDPTLVRARLEREFQQNGPNEGVLNIYHFTLGTHSTLLHVAAGRGYTDMARMLLDRGADVNAPGGYDDATPLHTVAWSGGVDMARFLVDAGADVDRTSGPIHENTPLGWAIVAGRPEVIVFLLENGATVQDFHRKNAVSGAQGAYRAWTDATPADYDRIAELIG